MTRKRDYRAEYKRRVERAKERGLPRSVGRGHAPKGVAGIKLAKVLGIKPGESIHSRPRSPPRKAPSEPTFEERLEAAGFHNFIEEARAEYLRRMTKKLPKNERLTEEDIEQLVTSREDFVQAVFESAHSEKEAYTAWFSPR